MRSQEELALLRLRYLFGNPNPSRRKHLISLIQISNHAIKLHAKRMQGWEKHRDRFAHQLRS